jgi:uncharacterized protein (DUF2235 family)
MKRLIICMDGTWQNMAVTRKMTNVARIALDIAPVADGVQQLVYYSPGIGGETFLEATKDRFFKGAVGEGAEEAIVQAYMFLSLNYQPGDEIYLFGFSRGAFCVRSLGGLVRSSGLIRRDRAHKVRDGFHLYRANEATDRTLKVRREEFRRENGIDANPDATEAADKQRPPIAYIGIFDTVVMRGVTNPSSASTASRKYGFHNLKLGSHVRAARHALAIDERRNTLRPTPWTNLDALNAALGFHPADRDAPYQQKWFVGAHGDVGGGESDQLAEVSRKWVKRGAALAGLRFGETEPLDIVADDKGHYAFLDGRVEKLRGFMNILGKRDRVAFPELVDPEDDPPKTWMDEVARAMVKIGKKPTPSMEDVEQLVHVSAYLRGLRPGRRRLWWTEKYAPVTLRSFVTALPSDPTTRAALIAKLSSQMQYNAEPPP